MGEKRLFDALVDDAGLFPPEELSMRDALRRHRADVADGVGVLSGRFVCPASRLEELSAELDGGDHIRLALIVSPFDDAAVAEAAGRVAADPRIELAGLEGPLPPGGPVPAGSLPGGVPAYAEIPVTGAPLEALAKLAASNGRVGAKIRCGGLRADLFPTAQQLGHLVHACAERAVAFKATAGLHHAVRYRDEATGFEHHGYLNLLVAASRAAAGSEAAAVAAALELADADALAAEARAVQGDPGLTAATRRLFVSYGSCSTSEPVDDLRTLGLIGC
jgi:hypothetical protein